MMKISTFLCVFLICFTLSSCKKEPSSSALEAAGLPGDFAFSFSYAIGAANSIDTYNHKICKDLVTKGTASASYTATIEELNAVYTRIIDLGIDKITMEMTSRNLTIFGNQISMTPLTEYSVTFTINGKTHTVIGDATVQEYIDINDQAARFWEFVQFMIKFMQDTDEFKALPSPEGGYD